MILIIDDDSAVRDSLGLMLKVARMDYLAVGDDKAAIGAVRSDDVELAILDMNLHSGTDGRDGIELLRKIKILRPDMPVILISAWGTIPLAVEGMNYGAPTSCPSPGATATCWPKSKPHWLSPPPPSRPRSRTWSEAPYCRHYATPTAT